MRKGNSEPSITTFTVIEKYRQYVHGKITAKEWREADVSSVTKPLFEKSRKEQADRSVNIFIKKLSLVAITIFVAVLIYRLM